MPRSSMRHTSRAIVVFSKLAALIVVSVACVPTDDVDVRVSSREGRPVPLTARAPAEPLGIELPNARLLHASDGAIPNWQFGAVRVEYRDEDWTATSLEGADVEASLILDESGHGAALETRHPEARADLTSESLDLMPFSRYRVTVEYEYLDGSPLGFICLHPEGDRTNLDLAFLPSHESETGNRRVELDLHTGRSDGPYELAVSLTGVGRLRVDSMEILQIGPFQTPDTPVVVVDLLSLEPDPDNIELWSNVTKFRDLYGFRSLETVHPLEVRARDLDRIQPALIVFSPLAVAVDSKSLGFFEKRRFQKGVRTVLDYATAHDVPVTGICAGHQAIAEAYGAFMARIRDDETGEYLHELGPTDLEITVDDPLFAGLPRERVFRIIEAHLVLVHDEFALPASLATTPEFPTQIFRYAPTEGNTHPWYTFQGHPEKDWEHACPEGSVLMANLMRIWGFHV